MCYLTELLELAALISWSIYVYGGLRPDLLMIRKYFIQKVTLTYVFSSGSPFLRDNVVCPQTRESWNNGTWSFRTSIPFS